MNPDRRSALLSALLTFVTATTFIAIAVGGHAYAPGARALQQKLASTDDWSTFLSTYWFGSWVYFAVRKTYGAIAFAILGFLAAPVFAPRNRVARTAILLGCVRIFMEIVERMHNGYDTNLESAFDVATGTLAAAVGAIARNAVSRAGKSLCDAK